MVYVITDGERWLRKDITSGKYVPIANRNYADEFATAEEAQKVYKNCVSKRLKPKMQVRKDSISVYKPKMEEAMQPATETPEIPEPSPLHTTSAQAQVWLTKLRSMNGLLEEASNRQTELNRDLSNVDKEISDALHYIENTDCNAYEGFLTYKWLKDLRIRRRKIKDELLVVSAIAAFEAPEIMDAQMKHLDEYLQSRTYNPRTKADVFNH